MNLIFKSFRLAIPGGNAVTFTPLANGFKVRIAGFDKLDVTSIPSDVVVAQQEPSMTCEMDITEFETLELPKLQVL